MNTFQVFRQGKTIIVRYQNKNYYRNGGFVDVSTNSLSSETLINIGYTRLAATTSRRYINEFKGDQQIEPEQKFIAAVLRADGGESQGHRGSFASFVGESKGEVTEKALDAASSWTAKNGTEYKVFVGELKEVAIPVTKFKLQAI